MILKKPNSNANIPNFHMSKPNKIIISLKKEEEEDKELLDLLHNDMKTKIPYKHFKCTQTESNKEDKRKMTYSNQIEVIPEVNEEANKMSESNTILKTVLSGRNNNSKKIQIFRIKKDNNNPLQKETYKLNQDIFQRNLTENYNIAEIKIDEKDELTEKVNNPKSSSLGKFIKHNIRLKSITPKNNAKVSKNDYFSQEKIRLNLKLKDTEANTKQENLNQNLVKQGLTMPKTPNMSKFKSKMKINLMKITGNKIEEDVFVLKKAPITPINQPKNGLLFSFGVQNSKIILNEDEKCKEKKGENNNEILKYLVTPTNIKMKEIFGGKMINLNRTIHKKINCCNEGNCVYNQERNSSTNKLILPKLNSGKNIMENKNILDYYEHENEEKERRKNAPKTYKNINVNSNFYADSYNYVIKAKDEGQNRILNDKTKIFSIFNVKSNKSRVKSQGKFRRKFVLS